MISYAKLNNSTKNLKIKAQVYKNNLQKSSNNYNRNSYK